MSAFLGPIHEKMYGRILYQDVLSQALIDLGTARGWADLPEAQLGGNAAAAEKKPLETIIDPGNIHGWLSAAVDRCECRFEAVVRALLAGHPERLEPLMDCMRSLGRAYALPEGIDAESAFGAIHDILLDGMPCDFPFAVTEAGENAVAWQITSCPHARYWRDENCGVENYYRLRDGWIAGALEQSGLTHERHGGAAKITKGRAGMKSVDILIHEHDNILRMLDVVRRASLAILAGAPVEVSDFRKIIAFIRNYADKTHHGKEEDFLFKAMTEELGAAGDNLVRHGMLIEHDIGRLYVSDLEAGLNAYEKAPTEEARLSILVAAGSYEQLLRRHIQKENDAIFPFGARSLSDRAVQWVEEAVSSYEEAPAHTAVREEQLAVLDALEKKYPRRS